MTRHTTMLAFALSLAAGCNGSDAYILNADPLLVTDASIAAGESKRWLVTVGANEAASPDGVPMDAFMVNINVDVGEAATGDGNIDMLTGPQDAPDDGTDGRIVVADGVADTGFTFAMPAFDTLEACPCERVFFFDVTADGTVDAPFLLELEAFVDVSGGDFPEESDDAEITVTAEEVTVE